jgi:hypothetical protein
MQGETAVFTPDRFSTEDGPHQLVERWFADANIFVANPLHRFITTNHPFLTDTEVTTGVAFEKRSRGNFVCHSTE